jgi:hypothetical protein
MSVSKSELRLELQGNLALLCDKSFTILKGDLPSDVFELRVAAARHLDLPAHLRGFRVWKGSQLLDSDHLISGSETLRLSLELSEGEKALLHRIVSKSHIAVEATEALKKSEKAQDLHRAAHGLQLDQERQKRCRLQEMLDSEARETKRLRTLLDEKQVCAKKLAEAEEAVTLERMTWRPFSCGSGSKDAVLPLNDPVAQLVWKRAVLSLRKHRERGSHVFRDVPKLVLKKVTFLHNSSVWAHYRLKLQDFKASGGCTAFAPEVLRPTEDLPGCGQAFLFHGTPWANVQDIKETSLSRSSHPENMFGRGIYFAQNLSKADLYTGKSRTRFVFVCRVALGREFRQSKDDPRLTRPPAGFDSIRGLTKQEKDHEGKFGVLDHPEYVVYDCNAVNPEYLLEYAHEDSCRCHGCLGK